MNPRDTAIEALDVVLKTYRYAKMLHDPNTHDAYSLEVHNHIAALRSEVHEEKWISVKTRLPKKGVTVLVLGPTEDGDGIGLDALDPDSDGDTWIEWSNAHERYISCGVPESVGPGEEANYTHWSEILPKP